jgi:hypothetical protein
MRLMYVIYRNPSDHPDRFVVRRWVITSNSMLTEEVPVAVTTTIDEARTVVPPGAIRVPREETDDPAVYETWV